MKSTGVVRKIDELGRVVLPIELRRTMGIGIKDEVEIYVKGDSIVLKKYHSSCVFCGSTKDLNNFNDKNVCAKCTSEISSL